MPRSSSGTGPGGLSHLSQVPITVGLAIVVLAAVIILALLRHLFGSIAVSAGTK